MYHRRIKRRIIAFKETVKEDATKEELVGISIRRVQNDHRKRIGLSELFLTDGFYK